MGHLEGTRGHTPFFKMDMKILLSLVVGVITLTQPASTSEPRVVCYYTNWSVYRPGTARFNPQNINPYLCTHLIYAFGGFTKDNTLKPFDKYQDIEKGGYAKFTGLKTYNKNLKTLLAIGGWNEGSSRFSPMVASRERRKEFVRNVIKFLRQNRFDGLDLDWEYPAFRDGGKPKDRENYAKLVRELREEFDRESEKTGKPRLLLTMAVPAGIEYIQKGFDVRTLNQYLDWMNLLTYDYHSAFEPAVNHHAPLYPLEEPNEYSVDTELNIDYTIKFYLENGADADKLVLGIPTYGRSYTLFNADAVEIGSPADGPGEQGDATREKGYLAYYEICEALKPKDKKRSIDDSSEYSEEEEEEWTVMHPNPQAMGPVAYKGNQWVGYDDLDIVKKKAEYVAENGLGGIMFWSIDNDDFRGNCHDKPYPLIEAAKEAYMARIGSSDNTVSTARPKPASRPSNRRNRPKASTTTTERSTTKSPKRKSSSTPSWSTTPAPPSTPDPGADFKCTDEGFFPHPRDCKKYFWCLDSGPSNLGIVAHQFTCPSGLFFNKAADSCDFARNVLCKLPAVGAPPAPAPRTTPPPAAPRTTPPPSTAPPAAPTTTRKPLRLSTKNSALFRTTTTTTTSAPESEEYDESGIEEHAEEDAEDPRVIKELIGLIKKLGGVEQLEKHLYLSEVPSTASGSTTTPSSFNKKLYQKVLERTRGKNKYTGKSFQQSRPSSSEGQEAQNSRPGPQNQGLEPSKDKDVLLKKDRPQYTTINRQRLPVPIFEEEEEESEEVPQPFKNSRGKVTEEDDTTTARPLQYVNIRRARPTDAADDNASRNALFERAESDGSALEPNAVPARGRPPYVPIRRPRPSAPPPYQDEETESETELQATALEREISSQPQYTSVVRARATTRAPPAPDTTPAAPDTTPAAPDTTPAAPDPAPAAPEPEPAPELVLEPTTPEPTTTLAVQISSLLNSPSFEELMDTTVAQTTEADPAPASSPAPAPRRDAPRRRGSTSTTSAPATSATQLPRRTFPRRTKPPSPTPSSSSPAPDTTEVETSTIDTESSTKFRRGGSKFKSRKEIESARNETRAENRGKRPSLNSAVKRNERPPNRTFTRRRPAGGNGTSTTTSPSPLPSSSSTTRRPFRIASRRRPSSSTTLAPSTSSAQPTTVQLESEESLQDIGDIDAIEDPTLEPRLTSNKVPKTPRRPLVNLKEDLKDQNPSATNEDETKRQSKKYSASFRQNQLDGFLKKKEDATEFPVTGDGYNAETALALATHQLISAPLPITTDYDEYTKPSRTKETPDFTYTDSTKTTDDYTTFRVIPTDFRVNPTQDTTYRVNPTQDTTYRITPTQDTTYRVSPTQGFVQTTLGDNLNIYDKLTTFEDPKTTDYTVNTGRPFPFTSRTADIDAGKVTLPTTNTEYTSSDFDRVSPTFEVPKRPTLSRYPNQGSTPGYSTQNSYTTPEEYTSQNAFTTPNTYPTQNDYASRTGFTTTNAGYISPSAGYSTQAGITTPSSRFTTQSGYTTLNPTFSGYTSPKPTLTSNAVTNYVGIQRGNAKFATAADSYPGYSQVQVTPEVPEPGYFTREYLLESPVTKTLDEEYQYISSTTPKTPTRKVFRKKIQRRISTTLRPTTPTYVPVTSSPRPASRKPFEKVNSIPNRIAEPAVDYYDEKVESVALKYPEETKVIVHGKGSIQCLDVGNFPHPTSCKKFISCARMEFGSLLGWEYICPKGLSFDPIGGICNWSAGLGCDEKDL